MLCSSRFGTIPKIFIYFRASGLLINNTQTVLGKTGKGTFEQTRSRGHVCHAIVTPEETIVDSSPLQSNIRHVDDINSSLRFCSL